MARIADILALLGRLALGALFVWSGLTKLFGPGATKAAIGRVGIDAVHLGYFGALGIELGVATMLIVGWKTRFAAAVLAVWCVAIAWFVHFHPASQAAVVQWLTDLALAGGLAQFVIHGAGRYSVDQR